MATGRQNSATPSFCSKEETRAPFCLSGLRTRSLPLLGPNPWDILGGQRRCPEQEFERRGRESREAAQELPGPETLPASQEHNSDTPTRDWQGVADDS